MVFLRGTLHLSTYQPSIGGCLITDNFKLGGGVRWICGDRNLGASMFFCIENISVSSAFWKGFREIGGLMVSRFISERANE